MKIFLKKHWPLLSVIFLYLLLFLPLIKGIGNYWDWNFPYFNEQWRNALLQQSSSWIEDDLGGPLSYHTWYYFRLITFLLLGITKLPPEFFQYLFLVILFSAGTYIAFRFMKQRFENELTSLIFSLALFINPAIFYKLFAGHLNYLVSYVLFIALISFLFTHFKPNLKSALILGFLLAFVGIQIQFFLFACILLLSYLIVFWNKKNFPAFFFSALIAIVINLPWLINFIDGANSIEKVSSAAQSVAFFSSSHSDILRNAIMSFSNATVIQYAYDKPVLAFFGLITLLIFISILNYLLRSKQKDKKTTLFVILTVIFFLLGTGKFHDWPVFLLDRLYPLLREIGHVAPIVILMEFLALAFILGNSGKKTTRAVTIAVALFVVVNAFYFVNYLPKTNFAKAREAFGSFLNLEKEDKGDYRLLSYPFFNQYGFNWEQNIEKNGRLLNNSGWDSFLAFSSKDTLSNYAIAQNFHSLPQYNLAKTGDIAPLEEMNVKYIYDFSDIYTSNFERYTDPAVYKGELDLVKNNAQFFNKLIEKNQGRITKVASGVYKLNDYYPRVFAKGLYFQKISSTKYRLSIKNLKGEETLSFLENYHPGWKIYPLIMKDKNTLPKSCGESETFTKAETIECLSSSGNNAKNIDTGSSPVFEKSHTKKGFYNQWTIKSESIQNDLPGEYYKKNVDGTIDLELILYFEPQKFFNIALLTSAAATLGIVLFLIFSKFKVKRSQ